MNNQVNNLSLDEILQIARGQLSTTPSEDSLAAVEIFKSVFDKIASAQNKRASVNIFVFHAEVPPDASAISYRDVKIDHGKFDYNRILAHCITAGLTAQPDARVILVTDDQFGKSFSHQDLSIVRLPLDTASPMYQRVVAMYAYTRSSLFNAPTIFLDGDAFLNERVDRIFKAPFDIAVTYRHQHGLMPINEGVMFANVVNRTAVASFFRIYLGTYDRLRNHKVIQEYYGDIKRWRGGQLSLNALTCPMGLPSEFDNGSLLDTYILYYPCDTFNFSMEADQAFAGEELDSKVVLHLKGPRKAFLDTIMKYQQQRYPTMSKTTVLHGTQSSVPIDALYAESKHVQPMVNSADRIYSLDTTKPIDYEPPTPIDYPKASLTEIADHFKTDKGLIKHNYTRIYEMYFAPLRQRPKIKLMEIGVACGSSLKMWSKYFADSEITGIDIREDCLQLCKKYPNIGIRIVDASRNAIDGEFDIVIDDGSHVSADIVDTFRLNWSKLKAGGLYIIEDLKCTHNPQYRSLLPFDIPEERFNRQHFVAMIDDCLKKMDWRQSDVEFIHFYREMAVLKKVQS